MLIFCHSGTKAEENQDTENLIEFPGTENASLPVARFSHWVENWSLTTGEAALKLGLSKVNSREYGWILMPV